MRGAPRILFALLAAVALIPSLTVAQTNTAELSGVVRDSQGGVLPGATVSAVHTATGTHTERVTDNGGRYLLPSLPLGTYEVTVALSGFTRVQRTVTLSLGQAARIDVTLQVGGVSEVITVSSALPMLQAANAEISAVIDHREVVDVPLNGRNFLALAQLTDTVVVPPSGTRGDALQQAGALPNVGGQRSGHNIYLLDGVKVTDELFNNLVINPSVDSIQEFKIQKSQYAAEFGGKASALINVATRSGTNVFRATAFEFGRDDAFDARGFFDAAGEPKPMLRQHQFGAAGGGAIVRDRTFFFGSYEGQRSRRGQTRTFSVPSLAARDGELGSLRIDPRSFDPIALALLQQVPLPNRPGEVQNLVAVEEEHKDATQVSVRVDHRFSGNDQFSGRLSIFDADEIQPFGTSAVQETLLPGFGRRVDTRARNMGLTYSRTIGSRLLNELRGGWLTVSGGQRNLNQGVDFAARVGLDGVTRDPRNGGYPQMSTRGLYSTFGDPATTVVRDNEHVEVYENVLVDRGRHHMKAGAYLFHLQFRPEQPDNARGLFTYSGQFTGNALGDFLVGAPASAVSGIGRGSEDGRTTWVHAFAQDDWRARDNLTLNLGLRYEFNRHMQDVNNRLSSVDLADAPRFVIASDPTGRIDPGAVALLPVVPLPYVTSAEAGWPGGLLRPSALRLAPRTGFALSLADNRAVIRGGYGVFLNQWAYSVQTAFARNLPFFYTRQVDVPLAQTLPVYRTKDILTADATGVVSPSIMDYDYAVEYTQTWSGGLQYQLAESRMVEVSYMGSWTIGADNATIRNVPEPGPGPVQGRRPIPVLGAIRAIRFDGKSIYQGTTIRAEQRLRDHYAFTASYTLSYSKDDASSPGPTESEANVPQNVRNVFDESGEWALSSFDHRHIVTASATWQAPDVGRGRWAQAFANGWRLNGVFFAQSGAPFTVNLGVDQANIGAGPAQRPDQLRNANLPNRERTPQRWFDTTAFTLPDPFSFGSARRNSVIGPGYASLDFSVAKTWQAGQARSVELRWEVFNAPNRTNFDLPNRVFGTANFGRIFSAKTPREMQFGLKVGF